MITGMIDENVPDIDDDLWIRVITRLRKSGFECERRYITESGEIIYVIAKESAPKIHAAALTPKGAWLVFLGWIRSVND